MQAHTVRITAGDHAVLTELAKSSGRSMSAVLSEAIKELHRTRLLRQTNEAYERLKQNRSAWGEEAQERRLWEITIPDGRE